MRRFLLFLLPVLIAFSNESCGLFRVVPAQTFTDVAYGTESARQRLDLYLPEGKGPFPLIVYFHGGGFADGDKQNSQTKKVLKGLNHGFAIAAVNYRFSDEVTLPGIFEDSERAVEFLRKNSSKFRLKNNSIGVWGVSAGGTLATHLAFGCSENNSPRCVSAVVNWFAPVDFVNLEAQLERKKIRSGYGSEKSWVSKSIGGRVVDKPEMAKEVSPLFLVNSSSPPFLIQHGKRDSIVSIEQSEQLVAKLKQLNPDQEIRFDVFVDAGHGGARFNADSNLEAVFKFLSKHLK